MARLGKLGRLKGSMRDLLQKKRQKRQQQRKKKKRKQERAGAGGGGLASVPEAASTVAAEEAEVAAGARNPFHPWQQVPDAGGTSYWWNEETNETSWDVPESVRCIEHMAVTWGHHPAMFGITVLNEVSGRARTHTRPPAINRRWPPNLQALLSSSWPQPLPCSCCSLLTRSRSPLWRTTTSNRTRPSASTRLRRT